MSVATKLEKLLISEVSGVDDPANELMGWMVAKAKSAPITFGPDDTPWNVGEAEARIRKATGAEDAPTAEYANCFLYVAKDATGDGIPADFGQYKFLVSDVVDGDIRVMPAALDAAERRLPGSSLSDEDKETVSTVIKTLKERASAVEDAHQPAGEDADSIVEKIKHLLFGKEYEVTQEELNAALDERFAAFSESLVETLSKASEEAADAAGEVETETEVVEQAAEETPAAEALSSEDITKAIEEAIQPMLEILDKTLDRVARLEGATATRKSLAGQETGDEGEPATPTLKSAIAAAIGNGASAQ